MKMLLYVCSLLMELSMIGLALSETFIEFSIFVSILSFFNSIVMSKLFMSYLHISRSYLKGDLPHRLLLCPGTAEHHDNVPVARHGALTSFLKLPTTKTTELLSDDGLRAQQYNGGYKNCFIESIFVMLDLLMLLMTTFS